MSFHESWSRECQILQQFLHVSRFNDIFSTTEKWAGGKNRASLRTGSGALDLIDREAVQGLRTWSLKSDSSNTTIL